MKYLSIITLFLLISCQKQIKEKTYSLPIDNDINEVIEAIVTSKETPFLENNTKAIIIPLSTELKKITLIAWNENKNDLHPHTVWNSITFQDLTGPRELPDSLFHFTKNDSSYIKFQAEKYTTFTINQDFLKSIRHTSNSSQESIYYYLTIPIFSEDKKKAYCQLTLKCDGLCGSGDEIYLSKVNNKWIVLKNENSWVS